MSARNIVEEELEAAPPNVRRGKKSASTVLVKKLSKLCICFYVLTGLNKNTKVCYNFVGKDGSL